MTVHGGDVWRAAGELGIPVSELLDFSANINPRGLPPQAMERLARDACDPQLLSLYPDPSASRLRRALSEQLALPSEAIAVGPGAEALLAPILRCLRARRLMVPVPAFSEYRRVCAQQDIEYVPFPLERSESFRISVDNLCRRLEAEPCDVVLLNNPHNPSGALLEAHEVRRIFCAARSSGATLVLDEAFVDYSPQATLASDAAAMPGLIVVRSLTKFYAIPGLRVGALVGGEEEIAVLRHFREPWQVNVLAEAAAIASVTVPYV